MEEKNQTAENAETKSALAKVKEAIFGKKEAEETAETVETEETVTAEEKVDETAKAEETAITQEALNEAIEKAKAEAVANYQAQEQEKQRKANLTPEELKAEEDAEKDKKIKQLEHDLMVRDCKEEAVKKLDQAGLPVTLANIIDYSSKENAEKSIDVIIKCYTEDLENGIKNRLKGKSPEGITSNTAINSMKDKQAEMRRYMGIKK